MGDGRTVVVLPWEARAISEQNLLVSAGSVLAGNVPAPNRFLMLGLEMELFSASYYTPGTVTRV
jgi:hypothetical protein